MLQKKYDSKTIAIATLIASVIVGGTAGVLTKIAVAEIPPFTLSFLRFAIALLLFTPFLLHEKPKLSKEAIPLFWVSMLSTINLLLFCIGIQWTTANSAQMLYVAIPILVALFSFLFYRERLSRRKSIGIAIGFIGVAIVIMLPTVQHTAIAGSLLGNFIIFLGVISYALYTLFSKNLHFKNYSPITITAFFAFTTVVAAFPFAAYETFTNPWWQDVSQNALWALLFVSILNSFLMYLLYQYAIKHGSPLIASLQFYLLPISTFLWANILLGEILTSGFIVGAAIAFIGVYMTLSAKK